VRCLPAAEKARRRAKAEGREAVPATQEAIADDGVTDSEQRKLGSANTNYWAAKSLTISDLFPQLFAQIVSQRNA